LNEYEKTNSNIKPRENIIFITINAKPIKGIRKNTHPFLNIKTMMARCIIT